MRSFPDGREVLLAFDVDIDKVGDSFGINYDDEGFILAGTAKILRRFFYFFYVVLFYYDIVSN